MKTLKTITLIGSLALSQIFYTQTDSIKRIQEVEINKKSCAVLSIDVKGNANNLNVITPASATSLTRRELSKLGVYQVAYNEDLKKILDKENINPTDCYDMVCLSNAGVFTNMDVMLSGYIDYSSDNIVISFREINSKEKRVVNSLTKEYKYLPDQVKTMVQITLQEMYYQPVDKEVEKLLTKVESRESYYNNNGDSRLNLSGTRMGFVTILGENGKIMKAPRHEGGFDASPTLFQFGYQFETMYLNQGRIQGLFEFIPTVTGLEQGLFIPSFTALHGIRDNKTGIEFAFGPSVGFTPVAQGYYDNEGNWNLKSDWNAIEDNPYPIVSRLDSRGKSIRMTSGFVLAAGFSLRSGNLNIPINAFTVMQKDALRFGLSVGLNGKKSKK